MYASTSWPASLYMSMITSLRKSFSDTSAPRPEPKFQTLFAHCSNSVSCVTPRSSVIASYFVRPGDLRLVDGSPPSRCSTTSVVRLSALTLLIAGDVAAVPLHPELEVLVRVEPLRIDAELSHHALLMSRAGELLQPDDDELGRLQRREPDDDVDDAEVDVVLRRRLGVALDEVRLARRRALEGALAEQVVHERADVEPDLRPERLVVRLEHHPLRPAEQALLEEERRAPHGDVLPLGGERVGALRACALPTRRCRRSGTCAGS